MSCGLVVIGGSWGGLVAVRTVLAVLPDDYGVPVVVVLHRSAHAWEGGLISALEQDVRLPVVEADDKAMLRPGTVYIAPADYHLLVEGDHLALSLEAPVRYSRPSIDVLFESAAASYGDQLVAVLLTGANDDGSRGIAEVKRRGGRTFVQDPSTAERPEMPAAAIATDAIDRILPLDAIGALLAAVGGHK